MSGYVDSEPAGGDDIAARVTAYEKWIDTVLRRKFEDSHIRTANVEREMDQYAELKKRLSSISVREDEGPLEMLTELGANYFAKVQINDPDTVFVHVALGFHVEFTLPEAISFADVKRSSLSKMLAKLKADEAEVARDLSSAETMLKELRSLSNEDR